MTYIHVFVFAKASQVNGLAIDEHFVLVQGHTSNSDLLVNGIDQLTIDKNTNDQSVQVACWFQESYVSALVPTCQKDMITYLGSF